MVIIEFFGPSGSGKSYFKKKLIKKYFYSSKTYDYKSINLNYNNRNYFVKIYFFLIKNVFVKKIKYFFNIKNFRSFFLSFFFKKYLHNIYSYKYDKEDSEKFRVIKSLIINSNFKKFQKKLFLRWAHEELIGSKLAREIKHINNILIDSEGLIQRLFIYCYKKKIKQKLLKNIFIQLTSQMLLFYSKNLEFQKIMFLRYLIVKLEKYF